MPRSNVNSAVRRRVGKAYRFIAPRHLKKDETPPEQYQSFASAKYIYRVL